MSKDLSGAASPASIAETIAQRHSAPRKPPIIPPRNSSLHFAPSEAVINEEEETVDLTLSEDQTDEILPNASTSLSSGVLHIARKPLSSSHASLRGATPSQRSTIVSFEEPVAITAKRAEKLANSTSTPFQHFTSQDRIQVIRKLALGDRPGGNIVAVAGQVPIQGTVPAHIHEVNLGHARAMLANTKNLIPQTFDAPIPNGSRRGSTPTSGTFEGHSLHRPRSAHYNEFSPDALIAAKKPAFSLLNDVPASAAPPDRSSFPPRRSSLIANSAQFSPSAYASDSGSIYTAARLPSQARKRISATPKRVRVQMPPRQNSSHRDRQVRSSPSAPNLGQSAKISRIDSEAEDEEIFGVPISVCEAITFPKPRLIVTSPSMTTIREKGKGKFTRAREWDEESEIQPMEILRGVNADSSSMKRVLRENEESRREREEWSDSSTGGLVSSLDFTRPRRRRLRSDTSRRKYLTAPSHEENLRARNRPLEAKTLHENFYSPPVSHSFDPFKSLVRKLSARRESAAHPASRHANRRSRSLSKLRSGNFGEESVRKTSDGRTIRHVRNSTSFDSSLKSNYYNDRRRSSEATATTTTTQYGQAFSSSQTSLLQNLARPAATNPHQNAFASLPPHLHHMLKSPDQNSSHASARFEPHRKPPQIPIAQNLFPTPNRPILQPSETNETLEITLKDDASVITKPGVPPGLAAAARISSDSDRGLEQTRPENGIDLLDPDLRTTFGSQQSDVIEMDTPTLGSAPSRNDYFLDQTKFDPITPTANKRFKQFSMPEENPFGQTSGKILDSPDSGNSHSSSQGENSVLDLDEHDSNFAQLFFHPPSERPKRNSYATRTSNDSASVYTNSTRTISNHSTVSNPARSSIGSVSAVGKRLSNLSTFSAASSSRNGQRDTLRPAAFSTQIDSVNLDDLLFTVSAASSVSGRVSPAETRSSTSQSNNSTNYETAEETFHSSTANDSEHDDDDFDLPEFSMIFGEMKFSNEMQRIESAGSKSAESVNEPITPKIHQSAKMENTLQEGTHIISRSKGVQNDKREGNGLARSVPSQLQKSSDPIFENSFIEFGNEAPGTNSAPQRLNGAPQSPRGSWREFEDGQADLEADGFEVDATGNRAEQVISPGAHSFIEEWSPPNSPASFQIAFQPPLTLRLNSFGHTPGNSIAPSEENSFPVDETLPRNRFSPSLSAFTDARNNHLSAEPFIGTRSRQLSTESGHSASKGGLSPKDLRRFSSGSISVGGPASRGSTQSNLSLSRFPHPPQSSDDNSTNSKSVQSQPAKSVEPEVKIVTGSTATPLLGNLSRTGSPSDSVLEFASESLNFGPGPAKPSSRTIPVNLPVISDAPLSTHGQHTQHSFIDCSTSPEKFAIAANAFQDCRAEFRHNSTSSSFWSFQSGEVAKRTQ